MTPKLRPTYIRPKPSDWGIGMSVCIASICTHAKAIVAVSDLMISTSLGEVTADTAAVKQIAIHGNWFLLFSASDIGAVAPIARRADRGLDAEDDCDVDTVVRTVVKAYNEERAWRAESEVLGIWNMTTEQFLATGLERFGADRFGKMCDLINGLVLDVDFLIIGFDADKKPHISDVLCGTPHDHDPIGYWAIGSGSRLALSALSARHHTDQVTLRECLYNLCEARFLAEAAHGVGRESTVAAISRHGEIVTLVAPKTITSVKTAWQSHTRIASTEAMQAIDSFLEQSTRRPIAQK